MIPELGYFEHRKAWQKAGHQLVDYSDQALDQLELQIEAGELDVVLVINPNNPTATLLERTRLLHWCELLARRGGCLIVDEAHNYKNIGVRNELNKFGLGIGFGVSVNKQTEAVSIKSKRSYDFRFKANYISEHNHGNNIFLLTATPTPNKGIHSTV